MDVMDAAQFMKQSTEDPQLKALLDEIAEDAKAEIQVEEPQSYEITALTVLLAVAAYALFRFLKDYFDHQRGLNETDIAMHQEKLVDALIKDGFKPKDAVAVTGALLNRIAKRGQDDPAFQTAIGLIRTGK
jgi:hypothetical protein